MAADKEITNPKELAAYIRARLQPGNEPGYPWVAFDLSDAEWALICAKLEAP